MKKIKVSELRLDPSPETLEEIKRRKKPKPTMKDLYIALLERVAIAAWYVINEKPGPSMEQITELVDAVQEWDRQYGWDGVSRDVELEEKRRYNRSPRKGGNHA